MNGILAGWRLPSLVPSDGQQQGRQGKGEDKSLEFWGSFGELGVFTAES